MRISATRTSGPRSSSCARAPRLKANPDEEVEQVERRRFAAMVAQDIAALEPLLADDLTYGHSNGEFQNKAEFLETIRGGRLRYEAIGVQGLSSAPLWECRDRHRADPDQWPRRWRAGDAELRYTDAYT